MMLRTSNPEANHDGVEGGPNPGHFDAAGCWLQALLMRRPDRR